MVKKPKLGVFSHKHPNLFQHENRHINYFIINFIDDYDHVFGDIASYRLVKSYRRFGEVYSPHLQGLTLAFDCYILKIQTLFTSSSVPLSES
jgi:hypothetical protein